MSIADNASVIFGGSDEPCALGNMYSIGAIGVESNGKIQVRYTSRGIVLIKVPCVCVQTMMFFFKSFSGCRD